MGKMAGERSQGTGTGTSTGDMRERTTRVGGFFIRSSSSARHGVIRRFLSPTGGALSSVLGSRLWETRDLIISKRQPLFEKGKRGTVENELRGGLGVDEGNDWPTVRQRPGRL